MARKEVAPFLKKSRRQVDKTTLIWTAYLRLQQMNQVIFYTSLKTELFFIEYI